MKKVAPLLLTIVTISFAHAQQSPSKEQRDVQQVVIKLFDALSARDAAALRNHCTADVRFYEYGEAWSADTLVQRAITNNTADDFKRTNKFDFLNTVIQGKVAWTTYYLHSEVSSNGKNVSIYWMETTILLREERNWKISVLHSTRISKN